MSRTRASSPAPGLLTALLVAACGRPAATPPPAAPSEPPPVAPTDAPSPTGDPAPIAPPRSSLTVHVFDWPAADRSELERLVAAGHGVVLADRGATIQPLLDCRADVQGYAWSGHAPRGEHVAGERFTFDATLVGAWTARTIPAAVQGACTGATHVARVVEVGAFEQATSSTTHERGDVALPGGGHVGGSFRSSTTTATRGGDAGACVRADRPPAGCSAVITMRVEPLPAR